MSSVKKRQTFFIQHVKALHVKSLLSYPKITAQGPRRFFCVQNFHLCVETDICILWANQQAHSVLI